MCGSACARIAASCENFAVSGAVRFMSMARIHISIRRVAKRLLPGFGCVGGYRQPMRSGLHTPMVSASPEIAELISRVALRDRSAFKTLYQRTSAKLYGVTLR